MASKQDRKRPHERLRHALWSGLITLVLALVALAPVDQVIWSIQAVFAGFEASGDTVFVGTEADLADPAYPERREELARAIDRLREAGATSIYLDMAFDRPSRPESDRVLNASLRAFGPGAHLVRSMTTGFGIDNRVLQYNVPAVGSGVAEVGASRRFRYFGIVWWMPYLVETEGPAIENAAVVMAGAPRGSGELFPINYGFRLDSIPSARLDSLHDATLADLQAFYGGKQVVVGKVGLDARFAIPGHASVPEGILHIYAAESLKAGYVRSIPMSAILAAGFIGLMLTAMVSRPALRRISYSLFILAVPISLILSTILGVRIELSALLFLQLCFFGFRIYARSKKSVLLVDQATGLPTFAALEGDRQVARAHPTLIVAKMHRFEEVRQTLSAALHGEYVLRIIDRINAAAPETKIYLGPGHAIAWCVAESDPTLVEDHLEGLRALFASPLQVGGELVDVGITFGVDISPSRDVARRLANAVAAAERTTETYLPILIAEAKSDDELIWNISLQARIDAALANNEIFLVYQPKVSTTTGEMVGMEALVRWRDPVRGMIPPDSFIKQCEETGRMGHLTRHVLREACHAGVDLAHRGAAPSMAVNISATLLHDRGILAMIRQVVAESGIDPRKLTLEITETYRISDMELARGILEELRAMGMAVSIDDFGVGAASLEALLRLPFGELKIDRIFIDPLGRDPKAMGIVRSILEMGRHLRVSVVAEGVEDAATLELLRQAGCPLAQGFGICRPVPLEEAVQFLDRSRKLMTA